MSKTPISAELRGEVAGVARRRCGYCQCDERYVGLLMGVDHLKAEAHGGQTRRPNLGLACAMCNKRKGKRRRVPVPGTKRTVRLFNPRKDKWAEHFRWTDRGERIEGVSDIGRATVEALELNHPVHVEARRNWVRVGWHPPST